MKFKYPGGEMAFWPVLWIFFGSFVSYGSFREGNIGFGILHAAAPIASILIWFDLRLAKWPIIAYQALAVFGGSLALANNGFDAKTLGKTGVAIYLSVFLYRWKGGPSTETTKDPALQDVEETYNTDSSFEPINIFSCKIDPRGVVQLLRTLSPDTEVVGPDDNWAEAIVPCESLPGKNDSILRLTHHAEYYDGPKWPMQVLGMQGYFSGFPDTNRKAEVLQMIGNFRFSLSLVKNDDLDIDGNDPRLQFVYAVCKHLDGVIFTPSSLRDTNGRILINAVGYSDPEAVFPASPRMVPTTETEDDDNDEEEVEPEPPSADRVARRALALAAVAERGLMENEAAKMENPESSRQQLLEWVANGGFGDELEPDEWKVLQRPVGTLDSRATIDSVWRIESLAVLVWALNRYKLPAYDKLVTPMDLFNVVGIYDADVSRSFLSNASLRSENELEEMRKQLLAFHWRLRDFSLRPQPMDFVAFSKNCWFGSFDVAAFRIKNSDLSIGSHAIKDAPPGELDKAGSVARERHLAINWLRGDSKIYSQTDTST